MQSCTHIFPKTFVCAQFNTNLNQKLMNENSLECNSNNLHDAIDDVDTAWNGGVNVEDTNSDGEAAVDVDEEDTKV